MGKKKRITRNRNHDDASSKERLKTWSDLNPDLLLLVMMQLRVIDFVRFSRVCKSWRSLALCNKIKFMTSRPPMPPVPPPMIMRISTLAYKKKCYCCLEDFEGRKFNKTVLPSSTRRICVGSTCGYLILFRKITRDFWLVNPITKHILLFPRVPVSVHGNPPTIKAILVFSPCRSKWVFIVLNKKTRKIWFSIEDKREWDIVYRGSSILDLHVFKGKIYALDKDCHLFEMRLGSKPYLTSLDFNYDWEPKFVCPEFVNSGENLYVMDQSLRYKVEEVDLGEMMWVRPEKTYALFISNLNYPLAFNPVSWVDPPSLYQRYAIFPNSNDKSRIYKLSNASMWYVPDWCPNDNILNES